MSIRESRPVFISDHDGTMTDADKEALVYNDIVLDYLSKNLDINREEFEKMLDRAKEVIKVSPQNYNWVKNGFVVAPASADHYIFNTVATEMVLEELRQDGGYSKLPSRADQDSFLYKFFSATSITLGESGNFYREGVEAYIRELSNAGDFVIVTNSSPDTVLKKLKTLLGEEAVSLNLVGNAKKYDVDLSWVGVVPKGEFKIEGFPRGVYLQRRTYYETLAKLVDGDTSRIAVCGDIPELDTLMVDYLGCRTALIEGETTSPWELEYYKNGDSRRYVNNNLGDISAWLKN